MSTFKCHRCGETVDKLIKHHTSYLPEVIEEVCHKCDANDKRHPQSRGFKVLKAYPSRSLINAPKALLEHFGDLLEIETAPITPVAAIFQYGIPLEYIVHGLELIIEDLQLRIEHQKYREKENRDAGKESG